jgi:rhomboid protease GluP
MKPGTGTTILVAALLIVFGIELATHSIDNETLLLTLGALPDDGELHGEYWRLAIYSLLHLNGTHLVVDAMLLLWIGRVVESRVNFVSAGAIYVSSVVCPEAMILFVHHLHPKTGATMGASGDIFGLFGAALIIVYREKADPLGRQSRLRALLWIALLGGLGGSLLPGISLAGHIGGLIGGAVVAPILPRPVEADTGRAAAPQSPVEGVGRLPEVTAAYRHADEDRYHVLVARRVNQCCRTPRPVSSGDNLVLTNAILEGFQAGNLRIFGNPCCPDWLASVSPLELYPAA